MGETQGLVLVLVQLSARARPIRTQQPPTASPAPSQRSLLRRVPLKKFVEHIIAHHFAQRGLDSDPQCLGIRRRRQPKRGVPCPAPARPWLHDGFAPGGFPKGLAGWIGQPSCARGSELRVVAISLYGSDPRYTQGAILNSEIAAQLLPDWQLWVYVPGPGQGAPALQV